MRLLIAVIQFSSYASASFVLVLQATGGEVDATAFTKDKLAAGECLLDVAVLCVHVKRQRMHGRGNSARTAVLAVMIATACLVHSYILCSLATEKLLHLV